MNQLSQKAHDISFAVFRVATLIKNRKLRAELENAAVELVVRYEEVANPALSHSATIIDILDRLISLAESVKEMKEINAQVLKRELNSFQTAIESANLIDKRQEIDISADFPDISGKTRPADESYEAELHKIDSSSTNPMPSNTNTSEQPINGQLTDRQSAILFKVREIPFCRLRNLMETFPDISERTIRNEIGVLIENSLVKRVGLGGPNSYFESMELAVR